jgi:very-short-patch-repair endonuclease
MGELRDVVGLAGGIGSTKDLRSAGYSDRQIARAVARGEIERLRRGVFGDPGIAEDLKRAVRVGGRLTCVSAARLHGLRVLNIPSELHVEVASNAARLRHPDSGARIGMPVDDDVARAIHPDPGAPISAADGVRLHWDGRMERVGGIVPLPRCLEHALACLPAEEALCILDSAREVVEWRRPAQPPLLDDEAFQSLLGSLGGRARAIASRSSTGSQAIGETIARERLGMAGVPVRAQVRLPGGYWADLLIGERLVFEVDGEGPHSLPGQFDRDRNRWAWLKAIGYGHLSFSHAQVLEDWDGILDVVRMHLRRRDHLWPARTRP